MSRTSMKDTKPSTIIWTSIFCIIAGAILVTIGGWFGWIPLSYGAIMLLVGLVASSQVKSTNETS